MELLDKANTGAYGDPVPTAVRVTPVKGKAILISGHDLKDLEELLKQTDGKGINIYTHGEMLPAHGYPKLKAYKHLAGNYGGAWQDQQKEFDEFPGAILMTTNCIQKPKETYSKRIFTTGLVAWPGVEHVTRQDFSPVIQAALDAPGFAEDAPEKTILTGFGHAAVMGVSDQVIAAVKSGRSSLLPLGVRRCKIPVAITIRILRRLTRRLGNPNTCMWKYRFNKPTSAISGGFRPPGRGQLQRCLLGHQLPWLSRMPLVWESTISRCRLFSLVRAEGWAILLTITAAWYQRHPLGPTLPVSLGRLWPKCS